MRLIGRTLLILAAALAVAGLTYLYASSSAAQSQRFERGPRGEGEFGRRPPEFGGVGQPGQPGRERERRSGGIRLFAIGEIIKNLVLIGLVIAAVRGLARLIGPRPSRPRRPPPGQPAASP